MPSAPQPKTAAGSIFDAISRFMPQSSGTMKASDALGMAASKADLSLQLAKLKQQGPVDGFHTKAWQDQMDALQAQIAKAK